MKNILILATALIAGTALAQPSYFSAKNVRDDLARRIGAYELECSRTPIHPDDRLYSYCMVREGSGSYPKSLVDIYYDEYMSGGWKIIDTTAADFWIRSSVSKDYRSLSINIIELGDLTYISVYDSSLAYQVESELQAEVLSRRAAPLGATPGTTYVTLGALKSVVSVVGKGKAYKVQAGGNTLEFTLGGRTATLNGNPARLNATPFFMDGSTYFPLASTQLVGCKYGDPEILVDISCHSKSDFIDPYLFSTRNPAATALQPSLSALAAKPAPARPPVGSASQATPPIAKPLPAPPASTKRPAGAVAGIAYAALDSLRPLGLISNLADGGKELLVAGNKLTYVANTRKTREGKTLEAMPLLLPGGELAIPLSSLRELGCSAEIIGTEFVAGCQTGESAEGVVLLW